MCPLIITILSAYITKPSHYKVSQNKIFWCIENLGADFTPSGYRHHVNKILVDKTRHNNKDSNVRCEKYVLHIWQCATILLDLQKYIWIVWIPVFTLFSGVQRSTTSSPNNYSFSVILYKSNYYLPVTFYWL